MSEESSEWEPDEDELKAADLDSEEEQRGYASERGYVSDGGYQTAATDDEFDGDMFGAGLLDPLALLASMEQRDPQDEAGMEPYEVLRSQRRMVAKARSHQQEDESDEGAKPAAAAKQGGAEPLDVDDEAEVLLGMNRGEQAGPGPSSAARQQQQKGSARRGRPRSKPSGARAAASVFGADVDDIEQVLNDPLAEELGLTDGGFGGGARRKARRKKKSRQQNSSAMRRGRQGVASMPEPAASKLGQANLFYATGRLKEACDLLLEVVKDCPNIADPYHTLGLVHEAMGNARKALDFYMVAAHLTPKDASLWKRLAALSTEIGFFRQAIYCLTRAIRCGASGEDLDARWDRAVLYAEINELPRALAQCQIVGRARPGDPEVPKMLARVHHRMGNAQAAIEVLEKYLQEHPETADLTHINILAELYMQAGAYQQSQLLVQRARRLLCADGDQLPVDLVVKSGLCLAHMGKLEDADAELAPLLAESPSDYGDLYLDVGNSFMAMGLHSRAVTYLAALEEHPEYDDPTLWQRLLMCYRATGNARAASELYSRKLDQLPKDGPRYADTCLTLAELYAEAGRGDLAQELLGALDGVLPQLGPPGGAQEGTQDPAARDNLDMEDASRPSQGQDQQQQHAEHPLVGREQQALMVRCSKLRLALGQHDEYMRRMHPLVKGSLALLSRRVGLAAETKPEASGGRPSASKWAGLEADDPCVSAELRRAIEKRRRLIRTGGSAPKGAGAYEKDTVFKGAVKKDRRSKKTQELAKQAEEYLRKTGELLALPGIPALGSPVDPVAPLGDHLDGAGPTPGTARAGGADSWRAAEGLLVDEEYFGTLIMVCNALMERGERQEALRLAEQAYRIVTAKETRWVPRLRRDQVQLLYADALTAVHDHVGAMAVLKPLLSRWPFSCAVWARFCRTWTTLAHTNGAVSVEKLKGWAHLVGSLRTKYMGSVPLMVVQGHVMSSTASLYTEALSEYFHAYRLWPHEPLVLLCIGVTFINMACTRRVPDRNRAVLQGFAFLQAYARQRGCNPESSYNAGRAAHQLGLAHIALHFYTKVLAEARPAQAFNNHVDHNQSTCSGLAGAEGQGDLSTLRGVSGVGPPQSSELCDQAGNPSNQQQVMHEAAHNLVMLYRASGADNLAKQVMQRYLVF